MFKKIQSFDSTFMFSIMPKQCEQISIKIILFKLRISTSLSLNHESISRIMDRLYTYNKII